MNDLPQARGGPLGAPAGGSHRGSRAIEEPSEARARSRPCPVPEPREPPPAQAAGRIKQHSLAAAMARGRRPVPFRTWKLRPGTAMVLHPAGCGRVARRRINTYTGVPGIGNTPTPRTPFSHTHKQTSNRLSRQRPEAHTTGTRPECCLLRCCNRGIAMLLRLVCVHVNSHSDNDVTKQPELNKHAQ